MPTRAPSRASASARLAAVVDLPTPPLPEATAITFFTPAKAGVCAGTWWAGITQSTCTEASLTPARFSRPDLSSSAQPFLNSPAA